MALCRTMAAIIAQALCHHRASRIAAAVWKICNASSRSDNSLDLSLLSAVMSDSEARPSKAKVAEATASGKAMLGLSSIHEMIGDAAATIMKRAAPRLA